MTGNQESGDGRWLWAVLTWLFRALLVGALAVFAFTCNGADGEVTTAATVEARIQGGKAPRNHDRSLNLTVLTFNVAGLPWPASKDRAVVMPAIGQHIAALADEGFPVDVILIQEGFIAETEMIADALAFAYRVTGAGPELKAISHACAGCKSDDRQQKWWKGEGIGPFVGSGLHIFSVYPVVGVSRMAFGNQDCAGYDCLANKGAILARVVLPGVPEPVDVLTTHLNSTNAAGVPKWETHIAHERQVRRLAEFWGSVTSIDRPNIVGGDFNIRGSHQRFLPLAKLFHGASFVKNTCESVGGSTPCDIDIQPEAPWLTSQDLQAFKSGRKVSIEPVLARTVLNEPVNGSQLSDHFGFLVRYRLSWRSGHDQVPAQAELVRGIDR